MRRSRLSLTLCALALGGALGLFAGCDPLEDVGGGGGVPPPVTSSLPCSSPSQCTVNACCGLATAITHVDASDAARCDGVVCTNDCLEDSVDCGRCVATCSFDGRCAPACLD